jgi:hypothetical protein
VTVTASGKIEKMPSALQFTFQISGKGDDVVKAAEALQAKQKAALDQLKALGVVEKEVVIAVPSIERKDPNVARMMRQARATNRLKKKKDDEKAEKEPVIVTTSLTARLPLVGNDTAAMFVESEQLKEKVKAAKLIEKDKKDGGDGEEDEEATNRLQYQEQQGLEDGFLFQFYAPSDAKDVAAAVAKAMESAKPLAEAAARASGRTLAGAANIELSESGSGMSQMEEYYYQYQRRRGGGGGAASDGGIVSMTLDGLAKSVVLKVTFGLK